MKLVLANGNVITGDGKTVLENSSVIIEDQYIVEIPRLQYIYDYTADKIMDANGGYIIPGVINHHAHGITFGPLFASAVKTLSAGKIWDNLNRHLLQGTTTILSSDGFGTTAECEAVKLHPMNVKAGTIHTHLNIEAGQLADGSGLKERHKKLTIEEMINLGAVAIGEVGAGATLGGGVQDYYYIPRAVKRKTGRDITEPQARALKFAALGRHIKTSDFDAEEVSKALENAGLTDVLTVEEARKLVEESVLPCFDTALQGFKEAGEQAKKFNVPVIVHNSAPSKDSTLKLARDLGLLLIAGHTNHETFVVEEAVDTAKKVREYGGLIDVASALENHTSLAEVQVALFEEGLIDLISTDFIGGYHDSILLFIEKAIEKGLVDLPQAIAMATSNVANAIPRLAPNRGLIENGKVADIVITDKDKISKVNTVIISGNIVVQDGKLRYPYPWAMH